MLSHMWKGGRGMIEYKIIVGTQTECQKWLNQWKHGFELNIISMCADGGVVIILLTRKAR